MRGRGRLVGIVMFGFSADIPHFILVKVPFSRGIAPAAQQSSNTRLFLAAVADKDGTHLQCSAQGSDIAGHVFSRIDFDRRFVEYRK